MIVKKTSFNSIVFHFGDVVRNVDETIRYQQTCGLERYVGLEHIDPDLLHIQHLKIQPGIVADRLQYNDIAPPKNFNSLKRHFHWVLDSGMR